MSSSKVWFITGSSRGLGRALLETVLKAGHRVFATARKPEQLAELAATYGDRLKTFALDVTVPADADRAAAAAKLAFGRIDVVVNNAGYGFIGAFEEMTPDEFKGQIDTNFWGVVNVTRALLPILREQRSGHIIQVTSIGGRISVPGISGYHAAKFAVEGFSEGLAQEIKPLGIKLTLIEPGGFRTDWAGSSMAFAKAMDAYEPSVGAMKKYLEGHAGNESGDPRKAAGVILEVAGMETPPLRLPLGSDALAILRQGYKTTSDELERWVKLSKSTDYDGTAISDTHHAVLTLAQS